MNNFLCKFLVTGLLIGTCGLTHAHGGYYGGGGHHGYYGGGGYSHHGYYGGGHYYGRGYGGGYFGGGWGPGVVIGVPFGGYYQPECQTIRVCNNYGHCWLQQSCY